MHSYAWSIKINLKPFRLQLRWIPFLIFSIIGDVAVILLLKVPSKDSKVSFDIIRYAGIAVSVPCVFLCLNEMFYLVSFLRKPVKKFIRGCDLLSILLAIVVSTLAFLH